MGVAYTSEYGICFFFFDRCQHFVYVDLSEFARVGGEQGTVRRGLSQERAELFEERNILDALAVNYMTHFHSAQV